MNQFCEKQEFDEGKEQRLKEHLLDIGNPYTAYFALNSLHAEANHEAAKFAAKIEKKELQNKLGLYVIKFSLTNPSPKEDKKVKMESYNGLLIGSTSGISILDTAKTPSVKYSVDVAYFKEPEGDGDEDIEEEAEEVITDLYAPGRSLSLV
jgi:hypothetical protein